MYHGPMIDGGDTAKSPAVVMAALDSLKPNERDALARYVFDQDTQRQIADATDVPRRTIAYRLDRARQKLEAHGLKVRMPGKGRRPARVVRVDPLAMERLEADADAVGYTTGRTSDGYQPTAWSDSRAPSSKTYDGPNQH